MIKLYKINDSYKVTCEEVNICNGANENQAVEVLRYLDVGDDDIVAALDHFENDGHNVADFGICKTFLFSVLDETYEDMAS